MRLYFVRSKTTSEWECYWGDKTDVWVFGDVPGYEYLQAEVLRARTARKTCDLTAKPSRSNSTRAVIVPAARSPATLPRVKIIERIVFRAEQPEMELIFYGNRRGYERLARLIDGLVRRAVKRNFCDPYDHDHINDWNDHWVVKGSVALNVRGPFRDWRPDEMFYHRFIFDPAEKQVPHSFRYLKAEHWEPYRLPTVRNNPVLSLDDRHRP